MQVRRASGGDPSATSWLVERLSPLLVAQAAWRLGPKLRRHYDPEDLVADAWLRLLPRLSELVPKEGRATPVILKFLATSVVNRVTFLVKKHLRREELMDELLAVGSLSEDPTGVVSQAVRNEERRIISTAILGLPEIDQQILILRGIEQRDAATVAELLGLQTSAASMRYQRALERLRQELPGSCVEELSLEG